MTPSLSFYVSSGGHLKDHLSFCLYSLLDMRYLCAFTGDIRRMHFNWFCAHTARPRACRCAAALLILVPSFLGTLSSPLTPRFLLPPPGGILSLLPPGHALFSRTQTGRRTSCLQATMFLPYCLTARERADELLFLSPSFALLCHATAVGERTGCCLQTAHSYSRSLGN